MAGATPTDIWEVDLAGRVRDLPASMPVAKVTTPVIVRAEQLCDLLDELGVVADEAEPSVFEHELDAPVADAAPP